MIQQLANTKAENERLRAQLNAHDLRVPIEKIIFDGFHDVLDIYGTGRGSKLADRMADRIKQIVDDMKALKGAAPPTVDEKIYRQSDLQILFNLAGTHYLDSAILWVQQLWQREKDRENHEKPAPNAPQNKPTPTAKNQTAVAPPIIQDVLDGDGKAADLCECGHPPSEHYWNDMSCFHKFRDGTCCECVAFSKAQDEKEKEYWKRDSCFDTWSKLVEEQEFPDADEERDAERRKTDEACARFDKEASDE